MANYKFSADLVSDILFRSGEPTDGSSDFQAAALQYLNRAYQALWMGGTEVDPQVNENWWWLLKEGQILTTAKIATGTVSVTNGSASITFSSAPASSVADFQFIVSTGSLETYKILTHTGGSTAATLDTIFLGTTNAAASYTLFQIDYATANDVLRLATPMRLTQSNLSGSSYSRPGRNYQVLGLSNRELEEGFPMSLIVDGIPRFFAQMNEQKVRFDQRTATRVRIDYLYLQRPADLTNSGTEEAVVPVQYRKLLADIALMFLFIDKNDNRANMLSIIAKSGVRGMALENRMRLQVYGSKLAGLAPLPILQVQTEIPREPRPGNMINTDVPSNQSPQ